MKSIREIQDGITDDFLSMGDGFEQYAYLIELSCMLPGLPESKKTEEAAVEGCQSGVWLDMSVKDGAFYLEADSNTLIVRGVLYLLRQLFNGQRPCDVAEAKIDLFERTRIMDTFETERRKGLGFVVEKIKSFCRENAQA